MRLGFVGTGKMGEPMAGRLIAAGFELTVWNRTKEKVAPLVAAGGRAAATPREVSDAADIVFTMVTNDAAVDAVYLSADGLLSGTATHKLFVDMSTVLPETVQRIAAEAARRDAGFVDAPVAGTIQPARDGKLLIFAGGTAGDFARLQPMFRVLSRRADHLGPVGAGAAMKLVHNALLSTYWAVLSEALAMGTKYGLDFRTMLTIVSESPAAFAALPVKIPLLLGEPAEIGFNIVNVRKDLLAITTFAASLGVPYELVQAAMKKYEAAVAAGNGAADVASIVHLAERGQ